MSLHSLNKGIVFFILCSFILCTSATETIHSFEKSYIRHKRGVQEHEQISNNRKLIKRQTTDGSCTPPGGYNGKLTASLNKHYFRNDSNPTISLTWSGSNGALLALTTLNKGFVTHPSRLYRSNNRGKLFVDISSRINNQYIRKTNGIQVSPVDSSYVLLLGYDPVFDTSSNTSLYITKDAGVSFEIIVCPFRIDDTTLKFNTKSKYSVLTLSVDHSLYVSVDFGVTWRLVAKYVLNARWDPIYGDTMYYTIDPLLVMSKSGIENELYRYSVSAQTSRLLAQHVHSFAIQDNFLFLSVQFSGLNGSRVMHVSKDQGNRWNAAQLPLINRQQFYSLLDMSEQMVFVHVDQPGDTGHGNIYTSDERGIVYSLSLEKHLYPNSGSVTDFYKVESLPGVYITTQLGQDSTVHSRITFDKGGAWEPITPPDPSACATTEKVCHLQLHNYFSASKGVKLPALPLSSKNTIGLIMAHGNIGDGLSFNPPKVYISVDGGYKWIQPPQLDGPHYYGMGDSGGLLFAIPATSSPIDTLKFSLDEGQCWHEYKFNDRPIQVTGLSAEPGQKAADISVWGWDSSGDGSWMAITIDFSSVLGRDCTATDYVTWEAHATNTANDLSDNCLLGARQKFIRRKKGAVCLNGDQLSTTPTFTPCLCKPTDFLCDYGYKRDGTKSCVVDPHASISNMDICINDDEELITTNGYRKIPGDKCAGGNEPTRTPQNLHKSCAKATEIEDNFGVDSHNFELYTPAPKNSPHTGVIILLVIAVFAMGSALVYILFRKRGSLLRVRYTPMSQVDSDAPRQNGGSLIGTTTVVDDDDDAVLVNAPVNGKSLNGATISYHDDSDEDLLVT